MMKKTYQFTRLINIPVEKAYHLAADVEKYPEFIPSVKSARILSEEYNTKIVEIVFHHPLLLIKHIARATFVENHQIIINQIEGIGKTLLITWEFEPIDIGTKIALQLEFESDSRLVGYFAVHAIKRISLEIIDYFVKFASELESVS